MGTGDVSVSVFPAAAFWQKIRRKFWLWLLLAVALAGAVLVFYYFHNLNYGRIAARISYNYAGIEEGVDPSGNRFDVSEIKQLSIVRQAAEAAGLALDETALEALQDEILIVGIVPYQWIETVSSYHSFFSSEDGISDRVEVQESSFFPSQYTVYLNYLGSGLNKNQGLDFLRALLSAYEEYFYRLYGYNQAIEETIQTIDYSEYDYFYSMDVLNSSLTSLRSFLSRLAGEDYTRFRSAATGYSFSDLLDAVDTVHSEDVDWLDFYIDSNNVTKNRDDRIAYLEYRIEDTQRGLRATESNLKTLDELIKGYEKTNAVILSLSGYGEGNALQDFQFSQQSDVYDNLIDRRVALQTSIRESEERIALYQTRIERIRNAGSMVGNTTVADERLARVDSKVKDLVSAASLTAEEYYREVKLKNAFQVLSDGSVSPLGAAVSLVRGSLTELLAVEGLLLGLYLLYGIVCAFRRKGEDKK